MIDRASDQIDWSPMVECVLDLLADRVANRVLAELRSRPEQDDWLDLARAAEHLGIHPDTLRKQAKAGLVPFEQDGPRCRIHFRRTALDAWREAGGAPAQRSRMAERAAVQTNGLR